MPPPDIFTEDMDKWRTARNNYLWDYPVLESKREGRPQPLGYSDMTEDQLARLIYLLPHGKAAQQFHAVKAYATRHQMHSALLRIWRIEAIIATLEHR